MGSLIKRENPNLVGLVGYKTMAKIESRCPKCGKNSYTVEVKTSKLLGGSTKTVLSCGHVILKRNTVEVETLERDEYWQKLFPFQREGVEFIERAKGKALIGDDMGLGKTVQALCYLRYHEECLPALYIVKSATKYQWQAQVQTWLKSETDPFANIAQVLDNGNSEILPFSHTIISMDMLEKFKDKILARGFKTLVIDESQNFKAMNAQRTNALFDIVKSSNFESIICLSGTPVMNRASEFFTTLNLIRPEQWRAYDNFVWYWCERNIKGTGIGGLKSWKRNEFHERTKHYILRREKRDVLKDLPSFSRNYEWIKIEDERIREAYNSQLKAMQKHLDTMARLKDDAREQMALLGYLEKLRQLCALSKIPWVLEYVESFLTLQEGEKIIIGLHHNIAIEALKEALAPWNPITLTGSDNAQTKFNKIQKFKNDPNKRVMIASMLAAGEGLDGLQHVCSQMLTLERQWNLAKERQFEARIDRYGQKNPVTNTFLLAKGTVDEYFTEVVLEKERYVQSAVTNNDLDETMSQHYTSLNYVELAEKCIANFV